MLTRGRGSCQRFPIEAMSMQTSWSETTKEVAMSSSHVLTLIITEPDSRTSYDVVRCWQRWPENQTVASIRRCIGCHRWCTCCWYVHLLNMQPWTHPWPLLLLGTALGWTSPANPKLQNGTEPEYDFILTEEQASWVGSSLNLGAAAVCIPIGLLINLIGRKWAMLGLVIPFTIGWGLITWAQNLTMLIIARVFIGIAGGAFCVAAPLYIGEIAQKEIRGTLGSYFQVRLIAIL